MTRLRWDRANQRDKPTAAPDPAPLSGPWTHIKREPVHVLTADEKAALIADRPDLQPCGSRARGAGRGG